MESFTRISQFKQLELISKTIVSIRHKIKSRILFQSHFNWKFSIYHESTCLWDLV